MFTEYRTTEELAQNLTDAGCNEEMISCLTSCLLKGDKAEGLCRLEERRSELLGDIHRERSNLAYLDELLVSLRGQAK